MKNLKINLKILLSISFLLILACASMGVFGYRLAASALTQNIQQALPEAAENAARIIDAQLTQYRIALEGVARHPGVRSMDWAQQQPVLEQETQRLGYLGMGVVSPDGQTRYPDGSTAQLGDRDYVQRAMMGESVFSTVIISRVTGQPVLMSATPIYDPDQVISGVLIARLDANQLSELTDALGYGTEGYAYIIDSQSTLAHPNREFVLNQRNIIAEAVDNPELTPLATMFQRMIQGQSGYDQYRFMGSERVFGYAPIKDRGWSIAVGANADTVFAGIYAMRTLFFWIAGGIVLLGVILALWVARTITHPIKQLMNATVAISQGDWQADSGIRQRDEVGVLADAVRRMVEDLRAKMQEEQRLAAESLRIRYALDSVSSSVMVTDPDAKIIYANDSAITMFRKAVDALRRQIPGFDPDRIRGGHFNLFNLTDVQRTLETLSTTYESENQLGGRTFKLVASPIADADGSRLGTVIEWTDRTEELKVEQEVTALVEGAVQGDLSRRVVTDELDGFFLRLGTGINGMVEQLQQLIGQITESVDAINTGAREIAVGNSDLSQRTEEQASSLEETASSMEELTSTVKQNADNARQANQLSSNAQQVATQGGAKIEQAVQAMQAITRSSEKISDIITVIDGIAFQTNILALNAAVEAARAGEQGRGFAVVAGEVRTLAQRSAAAAKEIKGLIAENSTTISSGSALVLESGQTMEEIVTQAKRVSDLIAEISAASDEQSSGIDQVNTAITQMDEVTQQNASLVEQAAAASESLEEQAQVLSQAVSIFRSSDQPMASAPAPRALPRAKPAAAAPRKQPAPQRPKSTHSGSSDEWEEF